MSKKTWTLRPLIPPVSAADRKAVMELNDRAFGGKDESRIIKKLEDDGEVWLEVVAESEGKIVGHIMFFPIGVLGKLGAMGLGPMSVDPKFQSQGVGTELVNFGLNQAKDAGVPIVFVLGHEKYYPRFGFTVEATKDFESEYKGPHFMAVRYRYGPPMSGRLIYPAAFTGAPRG